jgi:hypothetical protein
VIVGDPPYAFAKGASAEVHVTFSSSLYVFYRLTRYGRALHCCPFASRVSPARLAASHFETRRRNEAEPLKRDKRQMGDAASLRRCVETLRKAVGEN